MDPKPEIVNELVLINTKRHVLTKLRNVGSVILILKPRQQEILKLEGCLWGRLPQ